MFIVDNEQNGCARRVIFSNAKKPQLKEHQLIK